MIAYDDMSGVPPTGGGTPLWTAGVCGASAAPRARLMARAGVRPHGPLTPRAGQLIFAAPPRTRARWNSGPGARAAGTPIRAGIVGQVTSGSCEVYEAIGRTTAGREAVGRLAQQQPAQAEEATWTAAW